MNVIYKKVLHHDQVRFNPKMPVGLIFEKKKKKQSIIYIINKLRKTMWSLLIRSPSKLVIKEDFFKLTTSIYEKPTATIILVIRWERKVLTSAFILPFP